MMPAAADLYQPGQEVALIADAPPLRRGQVARVRFAVRLTAAARAHMTFLYLPDPPGVPAQALALPAVPDDTLCYVLIAADAAALVPATALRAMPAEGPA